jgi:nucleotide-binding universal stress UspA family protein
MSYKTIVLFLNDQRRVASQVDVATMIANQEGAHLIGLFVVPPVTVFGSSNYGAGMVKGYVAKIRQEGEQIKEAFETACRGRAFTIEWRLVEAGYRSVADVVIDHGRAADLVIAGQRDPEIDYSIIVDDPERLSLETGRPVLFVPYAGNFKTVGRRIMVAWNGRREASRAVFDALPLLKLADRVRILWINAEKDAAAGDLPTAEISTTLARHGVKCEAASTTARNMSVGEVLLSALADDSSDLLVMGAYGHSRLREFVLGGATRDVLSHMTVPVLMSH